MRPESRRELALCQAWSRARQPPGSTGNHGEGGKGVTDKADVPAPQPVLSPLTSAAMFLMLTINIVGEATVRDVLADATALPRQVGFRASGIRGELACIAGIGSAAWNRLFGTGGAGGAGAS